MQDFFDELQRQTIDSLIRTVSKLLGENDPQMKVRLDHAYQCGDYRKVQKYLQQSYEKVNHQLSYEMQQLIRKIVFASEDTSRIQKPGKGGHTMGPLLLAIALLVAIGVISWVVYTKRKPDKTETVSAFIQRNKSKSPQIEYTERDRDMLELIHLLATISNKRDEFLNS